MNYNDFPIIAENDYNLINQHYTLNKQKDRNDLVFSIYKILKSCSLSLFQVEKKYNQNILKTLTQSNNILTKLQNNLISTFNIPPFQAKHINNFSVFSFLKELNNIITLFIEWKNTETKLYYQKIIDNSLLEIINLQISLLDVLNQSSIFFFKHM